LETEENMIYAHIADAASSIIDVAQVAATHPEPPPAWVGGLMGMAVVMVALTGLWFVSAAAAVYFTKNSPKKTEAVSKAPVAAAAAAPVASQAASGIPLAVILAAVAQIIDKPLRSVTVSAPASPNANWSVQGREAIFSSHLVKSPRDVSGLSAVKKG